jgi:transposase
MGRKTVVLSEREEFQARIFRQYDLGSVSCPDAMKLLGLPQSSFYRRLARFRKDGRRGLVHRLRGRRKRNYLEVRRQVVRLYRDNPSLFVSFFYQRFKSRLRKGVAYSTVRKWLRERHLLRRAPRGMRLTRFHCIWDTWVGGHLISRKHSGRWARPWRRRRCWEIRQRRDHVFEGWEKPAHGAWNLSLKEKRELDKQRRPPPSPFLESYLEEKKAVRKMRRQLTITMRLRMQVLRFFPDDPMPYARAC